MEREKENTGRAFENGSGRRDPGGRRRKGRLSARCVRRTATRNRPRRSMAVPAMVFKYRMILLPFLAAVSLAGFLAGCGAETYEAVGTSAAYGSVSSENGVSAEPGKISESGDSADAGEPSENGNSADTGDTSDNGGSADTGGTSENGDTADSGKTSEDGDSADAGKNGTESAGSTTGEDSAEKTEISETVRVYVCGCVVSSGVYELPADARIEEAIRAAGGLTESADETQVNQAGRVLDGMQITVPEKGTGKAVEPVRETGTGSDEAGTGQTGSSAAASSAASGADRININTAAAEELVNLNGIGESRAADIIAYREANGPFETIEDIMKVSGIKNALFEKIKDHITV